MNEEEIIEECKKLSQILDLNIKSHKTKERNAIQALLDLYEKEKENYEEMCKLYYDLGSNYCDLDEKCKKQQNEIEQNYISKTKIRELLEKYAKESFMPKVEVDYERVFAKGVKSVKDKIKELLHSYSVTDERFMQYLKLLLEED